MWRRTTILPNLALTIAVFGGAGCGGDVEIEARTLASGRRIDVFRIFTTGSAPNAVLHFSYVTTHFDAKAEFDREWSEVVLDAQAEAERQDATELMLIASRPGAGLLSLASRLVREHDRAAFFRKQDGQWVDLTPPE